MLLFVFVISVFHSLPQNQTLKSCFKLLFVITPSNLIFTFFNSISRKKTKMPIELTGPYYADSYASGGPNTLACGWTNLTIGDFIQGRPAPYRIDHDGVPIGWAPRSSFYVPGGCRLCVGVIFIVRRK